MILGVVLAGGQSSRFGSDKALAMLGGRSLLSRSVGTLGTWCDDVIIAGRQAGPETGTTRCIPDWPAPGMGPLGGVAAGLRHANENGFDSVMTCSVDSFDLPADLPELLASPPSFLGDQPVIGHWPANAAAAVETILAGDSKHSMREFAEAIGAINVKSGAKPANINTPADLAAAEKRNGI
ncbi:molybdenum cofactor guanylyltransferase [Altererythrobacter fulvus]|uniref:molybdenum cofactor guanylyltransferase n=1 Tax=Caenibius fulvus TaxID=2126012 RepID=UPI00301A92E2